MKTKMITNLLKSLSDTELTAIAKELNNPEIKNITIYKQLMSKISDDVITDNKSFIDELKEDRSRDDTAITNLACKIALELTERIYDKDKLLINSN
jgi:hypothetical protein